MGLDLAIQKRALLALYNLYDREMALPGSVCQRGCSLCCTQRVTATTLEATVMVDFMAKQGIVPGIPEQSGPEGDKGDGPGLTFNEFVAAHLARKEVPHCEIPAWRMAACTFLSEGSCTLYPARPFGCRSFSSLKRCNQDGSAEVPPGQLTVNTVFFQIIEALDREGFWGFLPDVLRLVIDPGVVLKEPGNFGTDNPSENVRKTIPMPGLLACPEERPHLGQILNRIYTTTVDADSTVGELLKKARNRS